MTVVSEFTVPAEAFALAQTFESVPDLSVEVERLATHSREWIMPFLWVTNGDIEAVEAALRADPDIDSFTTLSTTDDVGQFNVHWTDDVQDLVDEIIDRHGIVQEAEAANGRWYLKLKFVDADALREFQRYFDDHGYSFELRRLYEQTGPKEREYDLTAEQREVLVTALRLGYFDVPRDGQIADLAAELGISTNAVSQRLRRATRNLTQNALTISPPADLDDE